MALINRFTRLFKADLHAVLDNIEEPFSLLKQAIREMEEDLAQTRLNIKLAQGSLQQLDTQLENTEETLSMLESDINTCFEAANHKLARGTIKRKLLTLRLHQTLETKHKMLTADLEKQKKQLTEKESRLESMRQKQEILSANTELFGQVDCRLENGISVVDDEVEIAFLQEQKKRQKP